MKNACVFGRVNVSLFAYRTQYDLCLWQMYTRASAWLESLSLKFIPLFGRIEKFYVQTRQLITSVRKHFIKTNFYCVYCVSHQCSLQVSFRMPANGNNDVDYGSHGDDHLRMSRRPNEHYFRQNILKFTEA